MHSTKLLIQNPPNSQYSHRSESNLPISPYFFFHYVFVFLPLERWGNVNRCNLQILFPAEGRSHTESHGVGFTSPSCPSGRAQKTQEVFPGEEVQCHCSSSHTAPRTHLGHLVPSPGRSQIPAVPFSSPLLSPAARWSTARRHPDHETAYGRPTFTISLVAYYCTWLLFRSLAMALLSHPVARTQGRRCGRPLLPLHFAILGFHKENKHLQKPKPSQCSTEHCDTSLQQIHFPLHQRCSPCPAGLPWGTPLPAAVPARTRPSAPHRLTGPTSPSGSFWVARQITWGSVCGQAWPIPLVLGAGCFLIGAPKPMGACSPPGPGRWPRGLPSEQGCHYSWFRKRYFACGVFFSPSFLLTIAIMTH